MSFDKNIDMAEVTRLTNQGRLSEAMSLLQGGAAQPAFRPLPLPPLSGRFAGLVGRLAGAKGLKRQKMPETAPGARFEERVFANQAGNRAYKLYVPSGYAGQTLPLVVMLHGCTQSPDDFAAGTRMNELAEEMTFFAAYPCQPQSANMSKCWNWYSPGDQSRGRGEPSLIAGITRAILAEFAVDPGSVYIAGLSAGGAAAAIMGAAYPDLYSAIGVHSGLACGAANDVPSAFTAMRQGASRAGGPQARSARLIPTIVFHGDRDNTVHPVNGDQVATQSKAGAEFRVVEEHGVSRGGMRFTRRIEMDQSGRAVIEHWTLHGGGHAWSGGSAAGSYTDPAGPDASREMMRFFLDHHLTHSG
jgi:poly(hydroxyalkanoate) depolymerase family esterase